jgi:hypothetical protein
MAAQEERFVRWEPIPGLPSNLDTPSLVNDYDGGFRLTLVEERGEGRQFTVAFEQPLAFQSANESYRLKLIESLQPQLPWTTFKVQDSRWVEWFHDQTLGIYREWPVEHFVFVGEDVVEVLSHRQPICTEVKRTSTFGWK